MQRRTMGLGLIALPVMVAVVGRSARAQAAIGRVVAATGEVRVVRGAGAADLREGSTLLPLDTVRTGPDGKVAIAFFTGLTVTIGPASETRLERFASSSRGGLAAAFRLVRGIVRLVGGAVAGPTSISVETVNAVAAVRSTDWLVERTADLTAVFAVEGSVEASARVGGSAVLTTGEGVDIPDGQPPRPVVVWGEPRRRRVLELTTV